MLQEVTKSKRTCKAAEAAPGTFHQVEIIYSAPQLVSPLKISSSADCHTLFQQIYDMRKISLKEFFYVALLNHANYCIGYSLIGIGNTSGVSVNIKEIFQLALLTNATAIIISHNHPSGQLKPSSSDITLTKAVKEGAALFEIRLLDHTIMTADSYYSMADEGLL